MYVSEFKPLLHIPESGNPYYNTKSVGGYSPCIIGNIPKGETSAKRTGYKGLNTLPNCVGYGVGRFNEIGGYGRCKYLANTNAKNMISIARLQKLKVTQEPTVGGLMVWSNGSAGHCCIVEIIHKDGSIITSESEWNGVVFVNYHRFNTDKNWRTGCYWMGSKYVYLGCVKNPAIQEDDIVTYEQFKDFMKQYEAEKAQESASNYAKEPLEWVEQNGIMAGANGEMMPRSAVTREQFATMLYRYNDKCGDPLGDYTLSQTEEDEDF